MKRKNHMRRTGIVKTLTIIFFLSVSIFCIGCGMKKISVNVETTDLLPKEIAIEYLNNFGSCNFTDVGVIVKDGEIVPFNNLEFFTSDSTGNQWCVFVAKKGWSYKFGGVDHGCWLRFDVRDNTKTSYEEIKKIATALTSLGIIDVNK